MSMPETAILLTMQVGRPHSHGWEGAAEPMDRPWTSGIFKARVEGSLWLSHTNLSGDEQADLKNHGGSDKAVLAYCADHYRLWQDELPRTAFEHGAFGENFTIARLDEGSVCVGDIFSIGDAVVQVSQPRQPCWKQARRLRVHDMAVRMIDSGRTGWYLRVLHEGYVSNGQRIVPVERPHPEWTIARANAVMHHHRHDRRLAAELASCPALSADWQATLHRRCATPDEARPVQQQAIAG